jgi:uncharacterized protein YodC (DUF2158 family)
MYEEVEFTLGQTVRLNSGSQKLTVVSLTPDRVSVAWMNGNGINTHSFPKDCLTLVQSEVFKDAAAQ